MGNVNFLKSSETCNWHENNIEAGEPNLILVKNIIGTALKRGIDVYDVTDNMSSQSQPSYYMTQ